MISRYKARTIMPADAVQWDGSNLNEIQILCPTATKPAGTSSITVPTTEGEQKLNVSGWLIKDVSKGSIWLLDDLTFRALFEL